MRATTRWCGARPWCTTSAPGRRYLGIYGVRFESIDTLETRYEDQYRDITDARAARGRLRELEGVW